MISTTSAMVVWPDVQRFDLFGRRGQLVTTLNERSARELR
jgi:hypothetical protein